MISAKGSVKSGLSLVYVIFILISIHFLVLFKLNHSRSDMLRDEYYIIAKGGLATTERRQFEIRDEWEV